MLALCWHREGCSSMRTVVIKRKGTPPSGPNVRLTFPDYDFSLIEDMLRYLAKKFDVEMIETRMVTTKIKP
jgi:hypothetical protein